MNVNNLIINTLSTLTYPVEFNVYKPPPGSTPNTIYFTFNYEDERAETFADNEPQIDVAYLQIHLFTPSGFNFMTLKKRVRAKLFKAGFTYPNITTLYEDEKNHLIFQCEIEGQSETED